MESLGGGDGRFRLNLLGPFGLFTPDGTRIEIRSKKSVALIALLATAPNGLRSRAWLQTMLWGSRAIEQAQGSCRRELSNIAKELALHAADGLLVREQTRVQLDLTKFSIDTDTIGAGLSPGGLSHDGDFLEGIDLPDCDEFEDWLAAQRQRCADLRAIVVPAATLQAEARDILGAPLPPTIDLLRKVPRSVPPKPSVAVLPFATPTNSEAEAFLGIGVAEEIELVLASLKSMFVVSNTSARALSQRGLTQAEIARELGVRYLIEGTVQTNRDDIHIAIRVIDGSNGQQLWGKRYAQSSTELAALQRRVAAEIAPHIHTQIDKTELQAALTRPLIDRDAYELYWRANALSRLWQRAETFEAIRLAEELVNLEPMNAWAAAMAGFCHAAVYASGWSEDPAAAKRNASIHYQNALRFGGDDPMVLGYAAGTLVLIRGDMLVADRLVGRALTMLPAHQPTLFWGGWVDIATGNASRARDRFELSLRVNPEAGVRAYALTGIGVALLMQGDFRQAFDLLKESVSFIPTYPMTLAALAISASLIGEEEVARSSSQSLRECGGLEQVLAVLQNPEHRAMLQLGMSRLVPS